MCSFKVRIANDGKVYAVFANEYEASKHAWMFADNDGNCTPVCFGGLLNAYRLPAWTKDSMRDAALHG